MLDDNGREVGPTGCHEQHRQNGTTAKTAAGGRAEGVPRSKCVLLEILHPHVQEQAAESLQLARYGPAKMSGLAGVRERRGRSALA